MSTAPARTPARQPRSEVTRRAILDAAARAIRVHGPAGVSVVEVMREAGLTHGGFYAHFESKDVLVAAAIRHMFAGGRDRFIDRVGDRTGPEALKTWIQSYVSRAHRDNPGGGCALATLVSDMPRLDGAAREAFDEGLRAIALRFAGHLPAGAGHPEQLALSILSEMAGAVALSRAVGDRALSDRILKQSRDALCARIDAIAVQAAS